MGPSHGKVIAPEPAAISARKMPLSIGRGDRVERRACHPQDLVLRPEIRQSFFGGRHDRR